MNIGECIAFYRRQKGLRLCRRQYFGTISLCPGHAGTGGGLSLYLIISRAVRSYFVPRFGQCY